MTCHDGSETGSTGIGRRYGVNNGRKTDVVSRAKRACIARFRLRPEGFEGSATEGQTPHVFSSNEKELLSRQDEVGDVGF
jgi:hypothetical protein